MCSAIAGQSGFSNERATESNRPSSNQPGGLQACHRKRAKALPLRRTTSAPRSVHRNHWYQNACACRIAGVLGRPGSHGTDSAAHAITRRGSSAASR